MYFDRFVIVMAEVAAASVLFSLTSMTAFCITPDTFSLPDPDSKVSPKFDLENGFKELLKMFWKYFCHFITYKFPHFKNIKLKIQKLVAVLMRVYKFLKNNHVVIVYLQKYNSIIWK